MENEPKNRLANQVAGDRLWNGVPVVAEVVERYPNGSAIAGISCPNTIRVNGVEMFTRDCDPLVVERIERIVVGGPAESAVLRLTVTALAYLTRADADGAEQPRLLGDGTFGGVFELVFPPEYRMYAPRVGERLCPDVGVFVNDAQRSVGIHVSADDPITVGSPVDPGVFHGREVDGIPVRVTLTLLCERLELGREPGRA